MNDIAIIVSLVTLGSVIVSIVVNISGMVGKREAKAAADARMEVKLDNIFTKVDSIERKQVSVDDILQKHEVRLTKVEDCQIQQGERLKKLEGPAIDLKKIIGGDSNEG